MIFRSFLLLLFLMSRCHFWCKNWHLSTLSRFSQKFVFGKKNLSIWNTSFLVQSSIVIYVTCNVKAQSTMKLGVKCVSFRVLCVDTHFYSSFFQSDARSRARERRETLKKPMLGYVYCKILGFFFGSTHNRLTRVRKKISLFGIPFVSVSWFKTQSKCTLYVGKFEMRWNSRLNLSFFESSISIQLYSSLKLSDDRKDRKKWRALWRKRETPKKIWERITYCAFVFV